MTDLQTLMVDDVAIAVRHYKPDSPSKGPGLVWLGGFRSDMEGTKAVRLEEHAKQRGLQCTRHDYSGHGQSGGAFRDGTISLWLKQSLAVFETFTSGPQILVGSSMGAWIALRMVQEMAKSNHSSRIAGLLLLAPAPDFTSALMEPSLTDRQREDLQKKGFFEEPTPYGPDPNIFTKALFDDGRDNAVMTGPFDTHCPVHIIQGKADPDVPWQHAQRLFELLSKDDASISYVTDGDHRLSREEDLAMIMRAVDMLAGF